MNIFNVIKKRRSIRNFKDWPITPKDIEKIIDAARWAPSAGNIQPWEFVIITTQEMKYRISSAAFNQKYLEEASVIIVVCADEGRAAEGYGVRGKTLYCIQDTAAAIQNILLAAYSLGFGSCWIGRFREDYVRKVINAPETMRPVALILIGYPNERPEERERRPLIEIIHQETF